MNINIEIAAILTTLALGSPPPKHVNEEPIRLPPVTVSTTPEDLSKVGGSVQKVGEKQLEALDYDNPDNVLKGMTGVNVRGEDGYGLRPNIGLRGTSSERSKKVTLMEDGILFGPAPYAAPAAYYFPVMTRMIGVEVFKGPAGIPYGPNTIGGAINLITRTIPIKGSEGMLDLSYGLDNYLKGHVHWGIGRPQWGFLIEGVHLMSDGFKTIDGGGDTGFMKSEAMLKARFSSDPLEDMFHRGDIKLGFTFERSHETYLGLTDADFADDPDRRYRSSALDLMKNWRVLAEASYTLQIGEDFDLKATVYRHDFDRSWNKLNRFRSGPSLADILADPTSGSREVYYRVLTGADDSSSADEALMIGDNARVYVSQGIDTIFRWRHETGDWAHELRGGIRYHMDSVARTHTEDGYMMTGEQLVRDDTETVTSKKNEDGARALAIHLEYAAHWKGLTLRPGVRFEYIMTRHEDELGGDEQDGDQAVPLLGLGLHYDLGLGFGILAGLHQGFSPVAPGQADGVQPEESLNFEAGVRWADPDAGSVAEVIGFFTDYTNLLGQCSFSTGCGDNDLDRQFNGGEVFVAGVEVAGSHAFDLPADLTLPVRLAYTFTHTEFQTSFESKNPEFGTVEAGDELPYVPAHQASLTVGVAAEQWGATVAGSYVGAVREVAGQGEPAAGEETDAALLLDASARYSPLEWLEIYVRGENLTLARPIASRRPFGARPGKPLLVMGGARFRF